MVRRRLSRQSFLVKQRGTKIETERHQNLCLLMVGPASPPKRCERSAALPSCSAMVPGRVSNHWQSTSYVLPGRRSAATAQAGSRGPRRRSEAFSLAGMTAAAPVGAPRLVRGLGPLLWPPPWPATPVHLYTGRGAERMLGTPGGLLEVNDAGKHQDEDDAQRDAEQPEYCGHESSPLKLLHSQRLAVNPSSWTPIAGSAPTTSAFSGLPILPGDCGNQRCTWNPALQIGRRPASRPGL